GERGQGAGGVGRLSGVRLLGQVAAEEAAGAAHRTPPLVPRRIVAACRDDQPLGGAEQDRSGLPVHRLRFSNGEESVSGRFPPEGGSYRISEGEDGSYRISEGEGGSHRMREDESGSHGMAENEGGSSGAGREIARAVSDAGGRALVVGGWVRDRLMGRTSKDLDLEGFGVPADRLREILEAFGPVNAVGESFTVYKVGDIDVSLPRRESKTGRGHKGFTVAGDPSMSIEDAARRRDFTINAIAWDPLTDEHL